MTGRKTPAPTRRRVLAGLGTTLGAAALAGCTGGSTSSDDDPGDNDAREDPESNTTDDGDSGSGDDSADDGDSGSGDDSTDDGDSGSRDDSADGGGNGGGEDGGNGGGTDRECAGESVHEGYEETDVEVVSPEGEQLGSVTAAIADTDATRYLGLSDTDCLPPDRGMVFVYQESQPLTFVMRDMDFGIDIVHIDGNGVITSIQHADPPGEGESGEEPKHQYPGTGQFVLEVNYNWTTDHGVETGDIVQFDL